MLRGNQSRHRNQRPKVDDYGAFVHVIIYAAEMDAVGQIALREIDLFFSDHYVVAVHHEPIAVEFRPRREPIGKPKTVLVAQGLDVVYVIGWWLVVMCEPNPETGFEIAGNRL